MKLALVHFATAFAITSISACNDAQQTKLARKVDDVALRTRFAVARFSGQTAWHQCEVDSSGLITSAVCDSTRGHDQEVVSQMLKDHDSWFFGKTSSAQRTRALFTLRFGDSSALSATQAVQLMELAVGHDSSNGAALSDLGGALLVLAERDQSLQTLLRALDVIDRSLLVDSTILVAHYNRSVALERLYLFGMARQSWRHYLKLEKSAEWKSDAGRRLALLDSLYLQADAELADSLFDSASPTRHALLHERIGRSPQGARDRSFSLLREWGLAIIRNDSAVAVQNLEKVRTIGSSLELLAVDQVIPKSIRTIDAASNDVARLRRIAQAHIEFADAYTLRSGAAFDDADKIFAHAQARFDAEHSSMALWSSVYRASAQVFRGAFDSADVRLQEVLLRAPADEPALKGKAWWLLGVSQLRRGAYESANPFYRRAAPLYVNAKETENLGAVTYLISESLNFEGREAIARHEVLRGMKTLSAFPRSNYLYLQLTVLSALARSAQMGYAAVDIGDEMLLVAAKVDRPQVRAFSHLYHARDLISVREAGRARIELDSARRAATDIRRGNGQERVFADIRVVAAQLLRVSEPGHAFDSLTAAVAVYRRLKTDGDLAVALYEQALAAREKKDTIAVQRTLADAITVLERQKDTFESTEARAALYETVEQVFDEMTEVQIARGNFDSALVFVERGRVAVRHSESRGVLSRMSELADFIPARTTFVEYAVLRNKVVVWTISSAGRQHYVIPVSRADVASLTSEFLRTISSPEVDSSSVRARLFDLLIKPIAESLAQFQRIIVVPDRELSRIPFAALWDQRTRQYLIQHQEISILPSATFLIEAATTIRSRDARGSLLAVGNPALALLAGEQLPGLPGAQREVAAIASNYASKRVLTGDSAKRSDVTRLLSKSWVFHFAGHAISNNDQPELSYLALAADRDGESGALFAREIGKLRLSNTQLVILSACSSLSPRATRTGPIAGLAYSFLRAGVPATISTLWDVDDELTGGVVLDFHKAFSRGATASGALRAAQLAAISSDRSEVRAPSHWAAYVLSGL